MPRSLPIALAASIGAGLAMAAQGASVTVTVTDQAGKPLADAVVTLETAAAKLPVKPLAGIEIAQAKREFNPALTVVTVGTAVTFPNFDTVRHHVYSFSRTKPFELKLYAGVPAVPVVFDKPGVAVLGCNIHDKMAAWVVVVDTPHYARSAAGGMARIDGVVPGSYRLRAWHAGLGVDAEPPAQAIAVPAGELAQALRLNVAAAAAH